MSQTENQIQLSWPELSGASTGDSAILSYNLYFDDATGTIDISLVDDLVTSFTATGLIGGETYQFKVRALNIYDYGDFSDVVTKVTSDVPN